jgi:hypothetical protein
MRLRVDALFSWFDDSVQVAQPCPSFGCTGRSYVFERVSVTGLTANGLVNVDPRGILYVIWGAGLCDVI